MRWHPPIPASKLYSRPALELGPALAMLAWCYDGIGQDGTIEVSIEQAAHDIGKPYRTIKDWWRQLREGPFFAEKKDCGRSGWRVRLADEWIDWRIMQHNYPDIEGRQSALEDAEDGISKPAEGRNEGLETAQGPLKARSKTGEGRNVAPENNVYGTHDDQESGSYECVSEDRDGTERTHTHPDHPAVKAYRRAFPHIRLSDQEASRMADRISDVVERLTCWQATIDDYLDSPDWKPQNRGNMYSRFDKKLEAHREQHGRQDATNGASGSPRAHVGRRDARFPDLATARSRQRFDRDS